jgi:large subunit ribosomal protein L29
MKMYEINNMTCQEVEHALEDTIMAYTNLRFQKATHQLDNPIKLRYLRRDVARLKTVLLEFDSGIRIPKKSPAGEPKPAESEK